MGRKTSVYLADDILAELAGDPRPLAEVIRAGLRTGQLGDVDWHIFDCSGMPHEDGHCCDAQRWLAANVPAVAAADEAARQRAEARTYGRGRTAAQIEQLRAHGGEVILAPPGKPEPVPDLGPRIIDLDQRTVITGQPVRVVDLGAEQRAAAQQAADAAERARNVPPRQLVQPDWRRYVSEEAHEALQRHGYPADFAPRGVTGDPAFSFRSMMRDADGELVDLMLRNRVCQLDGVEVDGHVPSDLDPGGGCMHCGAEIWAEDDD